MTLCFSLDSWDRAPTFATALGDMVLAWNRADRVLMSCVGAMLSLENHQASALYYRIASFDARIKMIRTLIEQFPEFATISPGVSKLGQLSKRRNRYVHDAYLWELPTGDLWQINYGYPTEDDRRSKRTKPRDVHQHSDAVRSASDNLLKLLSSVPGYKTAREDRLRRFMQAHLSIDGDRGPYDTDEDGNA